MCVLPIALGPPSGTAWLGGAGVAGGTAIAVWGGLEAMLISGGTIASVVFGTTIAGLGGAIAGLSGVLTITLAIRSGGAILTIFIARPDISAQTAATLSRMANPIPAMRCGDIGALAERIPCCGLYIATSRSRPERVRGLSRRAPDFQGCNAEIWRCAGTNVAALPQSKEECCRFLIVARSGPNRVHTLTL